MPGLWPQKVDASGCKKEEISPISPVEHSMQKGAGVTGSLPQGGQSPDGPLIPNEDDATSASQSKTQAKTNTGTSLDGQDGPIKASITKTEFTKRQLTDSDLTADTPSSKPDCIPQGLASPPYSTVETFTLGGQADSVYEYLPKEYMLLGGLEPQYQSMYEMSIETTKKYLLFRPMIEEERRDILFAGQVTTQGNLDDENDVKLKAEGTHLTCFVGGMFAIGAKIFNRKEDLDLAGKLTDGCVWAYESTTTGIMPEHFLALPCESREKCPWNETAYWEALDPYKSTRIATSPAQAVLEEKDSTVNEVVDEAVEGQLETEAQQANASNVTKESTSDETTEPGSGRTMAKRQLNDDEIVSSADLRADDSDGAKTSASSQPRTSLEDESKGSEKSSGASSESNEATNATSDENVPDTEPGTATKPEVPEYTQPPVPTQEEYAKGRIREERLPPGIVRINGSKYILR